MTWIIWNNRNKMIFEGTKINLEKIKDTFIYISWKWLKRKKIGFQTTLCDWTVDTMLCVNSYDMSLDTLHDLGAKGMEVRATRCPLRL